MLDFSFGEIAIIAVVILLVMGPKELPRAIKTMSEWAGKARGLAREFRSGVDDMVRDAELNKLKEEMEKTARKAEADMTNSIDGTAERLGDYSSTGSGLGDIGAPATPSPSYYDNPDWSVAARHQPLRADQRRKKPVKAAAKPALKARLTAARAPERPLHFVRRRARP